MKAQSAAIVSELPLTAQPASLRSNTRLALPPLNHPRDALTQLGGLPPTERLDVWPVPIIDESLLHAERARQYAAIRHHYENAGALVVVDPTSSSAVKRGAPAASVTSSVPGMSATHQSLQQGAWLINQERGQFAPDLLVALVAQVPWAALPPDIAKAAVVMLFATDAAMWRSYRVACACFGAATPAVSMFVDNAKQARQGKTLPFSVQAFHQATVAAASRAKQECAAASPVANRLYSHRDTFIRAMQSKAADVRLGTTQAGKLPSHEFAVNKSVSEDPMFAEQLATYEGERALLMQSWVYIWPALAGSVASGPAATAEIAGEGDALEAGSGRVDSDQRSGRGSARGSARGSVRTGLSQGAGSRVPAGLPATAHQHAVTTVQMSSLPQVPQVVSQTPPPQGSTATPMNTTVTHDSDDEGALQATANEPSAGTLAEQQQKAMREAFFSNDRGRDDDDDSSDDGTGGVRVNIQLREAARPAAGESAKPVFFDPSSATGLLAVPSGGVGAARRLGAQTASRTTAAAAAQSIEGHPLGDDDVETLDADDLLASGFAAIEQKNWRLAESLFARCSRVLQQDPGELANPQRLPLVGQYRLLCHIQLYLASPAMNNATPLEAMCVSAHAMQLRIANDHIAVCLQESIEMATVLMWAATSAQMLTLLKFANPDLFETPEGDMIAAKVMSVPGYDEGEPSGPEDAQAKACLQEWQMCSGTLRVDGSAAFIKSLVPCSICDAKFSPAHIATLMVKQVGAASALDSRLATCQFCGVGSVSLPANFDVASHVATLGVSPGSASQPTTRPASIPSAPSSGMLPVQLFSANVTQQPTADFASGPSFDFAPPSQFQTSLPQQQGSAAGFGSAAANSPFMQQAPPAVAVAKQSPALSADLFAVPSAQQAAAAPAFSFSPPKAAVAPTADRPTANDDAYFSTSDDAAWDVPASPPVPTASPPVPVQPVSAPSQQPLWQQQWEPTPSPAPQPTQAAPQWEPTTTASPQFTQAAPAPVFTPITSPPPPQQQQEVWDFWDDQPTTQAAPRPPPQPVMTNATGANKPPTDMDVFFM
jgi:hypothetical protein